MKGLDLRRIILDSGLTQVMFAQKVGISVKTLQNWMNKETLSEKAAHTIKKAIQTNNIQIDSHLNPFAESDKSNKLNERPQDYIPLKEVEKLKLENITLKEEVKALKEKNEEITRELFSCKDELISVLKSDKSKK